VAVAVAAAALAGSLDLVEILARVAELLSEFYSLKIVQLKYSTTPLLPPTVAAVDMEHWAAPAVLAVITVVVAVLMHQAGQVDTVEMAAPAAPAVSVPAAAADLQLPSSSRPAHLFKTI
jgi:hypothetical protein